jgi:CheY-like chemotaxis protein
MGDFSKLLEALATVSWPVIVFYVIWSYRKQVGSLIESARNRKFTIEVGGQKLSMEEVNQQQQGFIADLQKQLLEIRKKIEGETISREAVRVDVLLTHQTENSVLWVDDNPKNNSFFIDLLQRRGYQVDLALATAEALKMIDRKTYRLILSDMGRTENGHYVGSAGIDLLGELKKQNNATPFVVFCSGQGVRRFSDQVIAAGGKAITSSSTELRAIIDELAPGKEG